jgi:hypothetical protein
MAADPGLSFPYKASVDQIVQGSRLFTSNWTVWFRQTLPTADFQSRVLALWKARGVVPTPDQYDQMVIELTGG